MQNPNAILRELRQTHSVSEIKAAAERVGMEKIQNDPENITFLGDAAKWEDLRLELALGGEDNGN